MRSREVSGYKCYTIHVNKFVLPLIYFCIYLSKSRDALNWNRKRSRTKKRNWDYIFSYVYIRVDILLFLYINKGLHKRRNLLFPSNMSKSRKKKKKTVSLFRFCFAIITVGVLFIFILAHMKRFLVYEPRAWIETDRYFIMDSGSIISNGKRKIWYCLRDFSFWISQSKFRRLLILMYVNYSDMPNRDQKIRYIQYWPRELDTRITAIGYNET